MSSGRRHSATSAADRHSDVHGCACHSSCTLAGGSVQRCTAYFGLQHRTAYSKAHLILLSRTHRCLTGDNIVTQNDKLVTQDTTGGEPGELSPHAKNADDLTSNGLSRTQNRTFQSTTTSTVSDAPMPHRRRNGFPERQTRCPKRQNRYPKRQTRHTGHERRRRARGTNSNPTHKQTRMMALTSNVRRRAP